MVKPAQDPFVEDGFGQVDLREGPEHYAAPGTGADPEPAAGEDTLDNLDDAAINDTFKDVRNYVREHGIDAPNEPEPADTLETEATPPATVVPEVINLDDGSKVTIEQSDGKLKATLDLGTGAGPEVFTATDYTELSRKLLVAKVNASRKIRDLNRELKLKVEPQPPVKETTVVTPTVRDLSADEVFEIKTKLSSNPDLALQEWFQKKTGLSLEQLVALAKQGQQARADLDAEAEATAFREQRPDYWAVRENYEAILKQLVKAHGVAYTVRKGQGIIDALMDALVPAGVFTTENLVEAYDGLAEEGLLLVKPVEPAPAATPETAPASQPESKPADAAPSATDPRIATTVRRPRAALGIRPSDTTTVPPSDDQRAPSADELDNLSDDQISELLKGVRQIKRTSARR